MLENKRILYNKKNKMSIFEQDFDLKTFVHYATLKDLVCALDVSLRVYKGDSAISRVYKNQWNILFDKLLTKLSDIYDEYKPSKSSEFNLYNFVFNKRSHKNSRPKGKPRELGKATRSDFFQIVKTLLWKIRQVYRGISRWQYQFEYQVILKDEFYDVLTIMGEQQEVTIKDKEGNDKKLLKEPLFDELLKITNYVKENKDELVEEEKEKINEEKNQVKENEKKNGWEKQNRQKKINQSLKMSRLKNKRNREERREKRNIIDYLKAEKKLYQDEYELKNQTKKLMKMELKELYEKYNIDKKEFDNYMESIRNTKYEEYENKEDDNQNDDNKDNKNSSERWEENE